VIARRPVAAATLLAAVLNVLWALFLARDAGDLAAQYAWTNFVMKYPGSAYNLSWYGGMHPASYSLMSPYVMGALGVRTTAVVAGTLSAALAARLLVRCGIARPLLPSLWTAFALCCDVASGRVTFALGVLFMLVATDVVLAPGRARRAVWASVLGVLSTMSSPVAGLFVEVLAAALFFTRRRRDAYILAAGPPAVIGATALLFPFYGVQPFAWYFALLPFTAAVATALLVPRGWRTVRAAAWVYATGTALSWAIPSPVGSNDERLALLFGGTVLLCAVLARGALGRRKTVALYVAFGCVATWQVATPVTDFVRTAPIAKTVSDSGPLLTELSRLRADTGRVEVVPLRSHWEASGIAPYVNLARGWNRQADVELNPLFYNGTLTPATYHAWLRTWSVGYVVLPNGTPDMAGVAEAKIVKSGQSWLTPVWHDPGWTVYRVADPQPLATPPATVQSATPALLTVQVPQAGAVLLRIPYSPWLGIEGVQGAGGMVHGCLEQSGAWTKLFVPRAGTYHIGARYALTRGTPCRTGD
jgi:hypothetical protein